MTDTKKRGRPKKKTTTTNKPKESIEVPELVDDEPEQEYDFEQDDYGMEQDDFEQDELIPAVDPEAHRYQSGIPSQLDEGSFDNQMLINFELLRNTKYLKHLTNLIDTECISASGKRGLKTFLNNAFSEHTMLATYQNEIMPKINLQIDMLILISALKSWDMKNKIVINILNNIRSHSEKLITKSIGKNNERSRQDITDTTVTTKTEAYQKMEREMNDRKKKKDLWGF